MSAPSAHTKLTFDSRSTSFRRFLVLGGVEMLTVRAPGIEFPRHFHDEYVFTHLSEGAEQIDHGGGLHLVPPGATIALNPGEWHTNHRIPGVGFTYKTVYVGLDAMRRIGESLPDGELVLSKPVWECTRLTKALGDFLTALEGELSEFDCEAALLNFTVCLREAQGTLRSPSEPRAERAYVRRATEYLGANLSKSVTLRELSEFTGVSPFHLLRMFQNTVGVPPHRLQIHMRVAEAKRLLREGVPAGEVAAEVGFADQSHLNRIFRRFVGVPPGKFAGNRNFVQVLAAFGSGE